jgi:tripartite-type tricarboxylate transporter receptor subunit TctC
MCRRFAIFAPIAIWVSINAPIAVANDNFYAGKTIQLIIGFSAGGGYDLYARTVARYLARHIPGNPTVLPQNLPGAGSLRSANYLYQVAPSDGTVIAAFAPGIVIDPLLGISEGTYFEAPKFTWLGSVSQDISVCAFNKVAGIGSWQDMQTKPSIIGASGGGAESDVFANVLRKLFNLPFKIVDGYPGGNDIVLAMERHEVDGRCGWSWASLLSRNRALLTDQQISVTLQIALKKEPSLQDIPLVMDLVDVQAKRAALKLIISRQTIARPFAAPPGVPERQTRILRQAFDATMKDPDFLDEARSLNLDVSPMGGDEVGELLKNIYASPPEVINLASQLIRKSP